MYTFCQVKQEAHTGGFNFLGLNESCTKEILRSESLLLCVNGAKVERGGSWDCFSNAALHVCV